MCVGARNGTIFRKRIVVRTRARSRSGPLSSWAKTCRKCPRVRSRTLKPKVLHVEHEKKARVRIDRWRVMPKGNTLTRCGADGIGEKNYRLGGFWENFQRTDDWTHRSTMPRDVFETDINKPFLPFTWEKFYFWKTNFVCVSPSSRTRNGGSFGATTHLVRTRIPRVIIKRSTHGQYKYENYSVNVYRFSKSYRFLMSNNFRV